jgi:hypothetical protein
VIEPTPYNVSIDRKTEPRDAAVMHQFSAVMSFLTKEVHEQSRRFQVFQKFPEMGDSRDRACVSSDSAKRDTSWAFDMRGDAGQPIRTQ